PCGLCFTVVDEQNPAVWNLFIWVRHSYRNRTLGTRALKKILPAIKEEKSPPKLLRVCSILSPRDDRTRRAAWLTFFGQFRFQQVDSPSREELVLELELSQRE